MNIAGGGDFLLGTYRKAGAQDLREITAIGLGDDRVSSCGRA